MNRVPFRVKTIAPFQVLMVMLLFFCALAHANTLAQPYVLEGTEVRSIHSETVKRDYEIYVSLPASYGQTQKNYPVVFITDAPYAFPLVRSIGSFVSRHDGNLDEFILVGLSYAKGDSPVQSRNRDYTPADINTKEVRSSEQGSGSYGQAENYRRFVTNEVFPFVARNYRADMNKKVFVGHSYGGLFGLHALLTEPTMFNYYVLGSPSLWFGKRYLFDVERAYAATKKDLPAKVLLMVGAFEGVRPKSNNPRFNKHDDMVKDVQAFEKQLKSHHYPSLSVHSEVIDQEDHLTVFPMIATRGLMLALPAR